METSGNNALAMIEQPRPMLIPAESTSKSAFALAELAARSGLCKTQKAADAFFVIMYGYEIGIPAMTALRTIHIINNTPVCSGEALLAIIRRSQKVDVKITGSAAEATVYMKRRDNGEEYTALWTMNRATIAGLTSKDTWKKFPQAFLQWRGVSECSKFLCSDITNGLYTYEEIAPDLNYDESGDLVDGQQITITVVKKWHEEEHALTDLAERAFTKNWIEKRGEAGVKELVTLIAPKNWDDFTDRNAAGLYIKTTAEALTTKAQVELLAKITSTAPALDIPGKPDEPAIVDSEAVKLVTGGKSPFAPESDEPPAMTDAELNAQSLALVDQMTTIGAAKATEKPVRELDRIPD